VWSVGCLFYELLFQDFLFSDPDWTQFFVRVTKDILPIASDSAAAAMAPHPLVSAFLSYILVRNPNMRPSIHEVISKFDSMFGPFVDQATPAPAPISAPSRDVAAGASAWPQSSPSSLERAAFFRSLVPVEFSSSCGRSALNLCCWPPPHQALALNLYCVVTAASSPKLHFECNHVCVCFDSLPPSSAPFSDRVAAFRSVVDPCLAALGACIQQGGSCAICSSSGT